MEVHTYNFEWKILKANGVFSCDSEQLEVELRYASIKPDVSH